MKKVLLGNLGTKAMALLLALLTWGYLVSQASDREIIEVEFSPIPAMSDLATILYRDSRGNELVPGSWITVQAGGPKADVRTLRERFYRCEFRIEPQEKESGALTVTLKRRNFNLPEKFSVEPLPSPQITVEYVKYVVRTLELEAGPERCEGAPRPGYQVAAVAAVPERLQVKVPADRPDIVRLPIQKVRVEGRSEKFQEANGALDLSAPSLRGAKVIPLQPFSVNVEIIQVPSWRRITAGLKVAARPEFLNRIELETREVAIEIRGPEELLRQASEADFFAYVVVTEKDLDAPGSRDIGELGCHILNPALRGLAVTLMPDEKPEYRRARIKVRQK